MGGYGGGYSLVTVHAVHSITKKKQFKEQIYENQTLHFDIRFSVDIYGNSSHARMQRPL